MIGNLMVILAVLANRSLQLPCNTFLASLALADLGVSTLDWITCFTFLDPVPKTNHSSGKELPVTHFLNLPFLLSYG